MSEDHAGRADLDILRPRPPETGGGVACLSFSPIDRRGSLLGFGDFHVPGFRLKLFSCGAHELDGERWIALPSWPWVSREGELVRDPETHKIKYQPSITWDSKAVGDRFSAAAVAALDAYQPGWSEGR